MQGVFPDEDTAFLLAFSVIMLNTDAHNPAIKKKMSKPDFVKNNTGIPGRKDLPRAYLEKMYDNIVSDGIKMNLDGIFFRSAMEGYLHKKTSNKKLGQAWQKRWVVINNNCLYLFRKREDKDPRTIIPLEGLSVRDTSRKHKFTLEIYDENPNSFIKVFNARAHAHMRTRSRSRVL